VPEQKQGLLKTVGEGIVGLPKSLTDFAQTPEGQVAFGLLAAGRPQTAPTGAGQNIGPAIQNVLNQQAQRDVFASQVQRNKAFAKTGGNPTGRNVARTFITDDEKLGFLRRDGTLEKTDQSVKEQYTISALPDGSKIAVNNSDPTEILPVLSEDEARRLTVSGAKSTAQAAATTGLAEKEILADTAFNVLNQMKTHKGLSAAVGLKGITNIFPGTEAANFKALVDQVSGQAFSEAFQRLKGGGHITEVEGKKAEQAMTSLANRDQSEEQYVAKIDELIDIFSRGLEKERRAAQGIFEPETPASSAITQPLGPAAQALEEFYRKNPELRPK
jgi:hypothetical protein